MDTAYIHHHFVRHVDARESWEISLWSCSSGFDSDNWFKSDAIYQTLLSGFHEACLGGVSTRYIFGGIYEMRTERWGDDVTM